MNSRDRVLQVAILGLVALHLLAAFALPGSFWGLSHLAVWPPAAALAWSAVAVVLGASAARSSHAARGAPFPARRGALLSALASALPFWLLRERTHFFGDGYLLIRDRGFSETVTHAPVLVQSTSSLVRLAEHRWGVDPETTFAALAVLWGVVGVYALLRLCAHLTHDRGGRFFLAALLGTAGSMQLFFGHVEYYAAVAAGV
ncbi:MAG: hypothetical protein ACE5G2_09280, partial [Candidatus Krumholzibacteriia bacterium]